MELLLRFFAIITSMVVYRLTLFALAWLVVMVSGVSITSDLVYLFIGIEAALCGFLAALELERIYDRINNN